MNVSDSSGDVGASSSSSSEDNWRRRLADDNHMPTALDVREGPVASKGHLRGSTWIFVDLLGKLIFVTVPGSVEEERMFSSIERLKSLQRNKLLH